MIFKTKGTFMALSLAVVFLAGCSNEILDQYVVNRALVPNEATFAKGDVPPDPVNLDVFRFPEAVNATDTAYVTIAKGAPADAGTILLRNRLLDHVMGVSDEICTYHKAAIIANAATFNFAAGWSSTILSSVSAAVGGEAVKTALSTTAAIIGAGQAQANAEFYNNLISTAIVKKIGILRENKRAAIKGKGKKTLSEYTLEESISDLQSYHFECSFFAGLVALTDDDATRVVQTREQIDDEIEALTDETDKLMAKLATERTKAILDTAKISALQIQVALNNQRLLELRQNRLKSPKQ